MKTVPWNKGKTMSKEARLKMVQGKSKPYNVYLNGNLVIKELVVQGGAIPTWKEIRKQLNMKITREMFYNMVRTGEEYNGVRIERIG